MAWISTLLRMRGRPYIFSNLGRGINLEAAPYAISEGQARNGRNFHTSPVGTITKRNGCVTHSTPDAALTSLFPLHTSTRYLIGAGSTKLYKIATDGTVSDLKTSLTNNKRWEFVQAPTSGGQGPLWGLNGTDTPQQWDGSAATSSNWTAASGTLPNGKYIAYHNNRIAIAGTSSNPSRLYLSALVDPAGSVDGARNWSTPDAVTIDFDPNDGQEITAIGKVGPYLLVFKPRKTFLVTDTDNGSYRVLNSEVGCSANRTVTETSNGTYFLSTEGAVYVTNGTTMTDISGDIRPVLAAIPGTSVSYACGIFYDQKYYLSIPQSGNTCELICEFDLATNTWWLHAIQFTSSIVGAVTQFAILEPSGSNILYGALDGTAKVAEMFKNATFQDFDNNYVAYWNGPWLSFGMPHLRKNLREIRVDGLGQFDVYTQNSFSTTESAQETTFWEVATEGTTFGGTGDFGGTGTYGDSATITERRYYTPGVGRVWSVQFKSTNNEDCQIYSYTLALDTRRD